MHFASDSDGSDDSDFENVDADGNIVQVHDQENGGELDSADEDVDISMSSGDEDSLRADLEEDIIIDQEREEPAAPPDGKVGQQDAWEIEEILDQKYRRRGQTRQKMYLVRWKGDHPDDWLHYSHLRGAPDVVKAWQNKQVVEANTMTFQHCKVYHQHSIVAETEFIPAKVEETKENPFKHLFDITKRPRVKPPRGKREMEAHEFSEYFKLANLKEKMENLHWKAYEEVLRKSVPYGNRILKPVTNYEIKYNERGEIEKFKARVCLDGSRTVVPENETYECIASFATIRFLLCLSTRYGMDIVQTDVRNFFLQARMPAGKEYYAEIPDGWAENDPKTHVAKCLAPWYGLKESAKIAGDQLAALLTSVGMIENVMMPKVFFKWDQDDFIVCACHIDDAVWCTTSMKKLNYLLDRVDKSFALTRTYEPTKLLGIEIQYDKVKGVMKIHQGSYMRAKLMELGHHAINRKTNSPGYIPPTKPNPDWKGNVKVKATDEEVRLYQRKIGIQMWALQSDPSSMYVVHKLASSMLNPQPDDWKGIKRLEDYRNTYPEVGVVFHRALSKEKLTKGHNLDCLTYYADADFGGDVRDSKSISGYCVFLGESGMFDWKSKKQTCVSQSSCESEVFASKECTCHAMWMRQALTIMGFKFTKPTPVCQDNSGAIALCHSDKHHSRTRHFRMHVHLLKDCVEKRITTYPWVPSLHMKGDLYNKIHGPSDHLRLCAMNGIHLMCGIDHVDPPELLQVFGWTEKVKAEKEKKMATDK